MSVLFRSFLPLENPIGFGFQDFVEFSFALLIVAFSLALARVLQSRRGLADFLSLILAGFATYSLTSFGVGKLRPVRGRPAVERRVVNPPPSSPPVSPAVEKPARKTEPVLRKKQVSPFEEVK